MAKLPRSVIVCGTTYVVRLGDEDDEEELKDRDGVTCHTEASIWIQRKLAETRRQGVLRHELAHVVLFEHGLDEDFRRQFGLSAERFEDVEEFICNAFAPAFWDALERNGLLRGGK